MVILLHFCGIISLYYWKPQFGGYMIRGIKELVDLLLLWGFWYLGAFMIMVVAIVYFIKSNPTPIINHHYSTVQVIEPPKRVLIEKEICTKIDGCPIVNGVCVDCLTVKN